MDLGFAALIAIVVGPFVVGWWVGHPLFAAAVFVALALTVFLGAVGRGDTAGDPGLGLALSLVVSSASAALGGHLRARRRDTRMRRR
ncbi:MAG: hypothetical protein M3320_05990 [Actinomycetota bacterium]|nr:hypothetical protein [Actinomycetota bacterium]MDQ5808209.1 hypothetical protein [Actinomycetota bacterium]